MSKLMYKVVDVTEVMSAIKNTREAQGLSHEDLAKRVGMDKTTIYKWERDGREGGCCQVARVLLALGLTPNQVLLEETSLEKQAAEMVRPELQDDVRRVVLALVMLDRMCEGAPDGPVKVFAEHVEGLNRQFLGAKATPAAPSLPRASEPHISSTLLLSEEEARALRTYIGSQVKSMPSERPLTKAFRKIAMLSGRGAALRALPPGQAQVPASPDPAVKNESSDAVPETLPHRRKQGPGKP